MRPNKGTHRKNASLSLLLHKCSTVEGMRKERKHFLPKYFPFNGNSLCICVAYILYHISANLSIKLENLTKYYCFSLLIRSPCLHIKKVRNRSYAPKNVAPCRDANFFTLPYNTEKHTKREHTFLPKGKKVYLSHVNHGRVILFSLRRKDIITYS